MRQEKTKIIFQQEIKDRYFHLGIKTRLLAKQSSPGQFIHVKINTGLEPFLRRPFSIHNVNKAQLEIMYEVVGRGTEILSQKKPDEYLDVVGPLGKGFSFTETTNQRNNASTVLVAGGMGVAPLVFLAEKLTECKIQNAKFKIIVLIGAKTKNAILCAEEFKRLGCEIKVATDDGSKGFRGKVTDLLKYLLSSSSLEPSTIYACGPPAMLKEIAHISRQYKILAQISLEEHLACGIGACLGCVVKTKSGFKRVCKEGPVFAAGEIIWH